MSPSNTSQAPIPDAFGVLEVVVRGFPQPRLQVGQFLLWCGRPWPAVSERHRVVLGVGQRGAKVVVEDFVQVPEAVGIDWRVCVAADRVLGKPSRHHFSGTSSSPIGGRSIGVLRRPSSRGEDAAVRMIPRAPQSTQRRPRWASTVSRSCSRMFRAFCDVCRISKLSITQMNPPTSVLGKHSASQCSTM